MRMPDSLETQMKRLFLLVSLIVLINLPLAVIAGEAVKAKAPRDSVAITRVAMYDDDRSYFADDTMAFEVKAFAPPSGPIGVSPVTEAKTFLLTTADRSWVTDWHPTPRRQYVIMLAGSITVEVESGEKRMFKRGDILLLEDTRGRGHDSHVVSDEPAMFAMIALPD